jgi:hypothetical protein
VSGVWGEGFKRTAFPAINAGITQLTDVKYGKLGQVAAKIGKQGMKTQAYFHGAIQSTTPIGIRRMNLLNPGLSVSFRGISARDDSAMESM